MHKDEHRRKLEALRDHLEEAMATATPNMLPQLAGQYRGTLDDLSKIEAAEVKVGIQDDLREKRAARRKAQRSA